MYTSFAEFYPFYLSQHANRLCRRWHFIGSTLALICLAQLLMTFDWWWGPAALVAGYGCAWIGHFVHEKNRPATFTYPLYSFRGDWVMYWQMLNGKISW
ncbi:DUF962 domain-containing protein [Massilia sp. TS11]|uniref:DUF962 domain-containing protein n=1 Tax=Massilia sp. TS11 TaxID=2908003 RepID=UPI001EDA5282|nr:DUF962 domain-containing protein [Massilia sp. TS11]MCG2584622.1 DUF962 domain-containing protein [Massilia sp. TS11]